MTQKTSACSIQRDQQRAEGSYENLKGVSAVGQSSSLSSAGWLSHATQTQTSLLPNHCISVSVIQILYISFRGRRGVVWIQISRQGTACIEAGLIFPAWSAFSKPESSPWCLLCPAAGLPPTQCILPCHHVLYFLLLSEGHRNIAMHWLNLLANSSECAIICKTTIED